MDPDSGPNRVPTARLFGLHLVRRAPGVPNTASNSVEWLLSIRSNDRQPVTSGENKACTAAEDPLHSSPHQTIFIAGCAPSAHQDVLMH